jgi:peptidoglycan/xylan/chitin deacetylase (PgdA/CDA1 family)
VRPSALLRSARDTRLPRLLAPLAPGMVFRGAPRDADGRPLLYLTVDDGPSADGTPRWLDTLDAHGARALFFLSGEALAQRPNSARALVDAGHRLGNHGEAHVSAWRMRSDTLHAAYSAAEALLDAQAGARVRDVRPPYGRVSPSLLRWCRAGGRRLVLWDLLPGDYWPGATADGVAAELLRHARPGSVAVFHDGAPARVACGALALALPRLAAAGWRFPALPAAC